MFARSFQRYGWVFEGQDFAEFFDKYFTFEDRILILRYGAPIFYFFAGTFYLPTFKLKSLSPKIKQNPQTHSLSNLYQTL